MNAVFCVLCSLLMFVSDASGDHMVETYSSMTRAEDYPSSFIDLWTFSKQPWSAESLSDPNMEELSMKPEIGTKKLIILTSISLQPALAVMSIIHQKNIF